jgi:biopolymer transport protein TolR
MPALASRSSKGRRTINEINMVPFIDVMLVLLIIFMVTAPLISPSTIDVPSIGKASQAPDQVITIEIHKDKSIEIKSKSNVSKQGVDTTLKATLDNIGQQVLSLQSESANTPVIISADRTLPYEEVITVMDKLQKAGVQRVGLSVQLLD